MPIGKLVLIYKAMGICLIFCKQEVRSKFTLHFNVYKNHADPHCLAKQNKLINRHWGLGVAPSVYRVFDSGNYTCYTIKGTGLGVVSLYKE